MQTGDLAYQLAAKHLTPASLVLVTGAASRSWYVDRNLLVDILFFASGVELIWASGEPAFLNALRWVDGHCGSGVDFTKPDIGGLALCIALPSRTSESMLSAPDLQVALEHEIPSLVIWPDRQAVYVKNLEEAGAVWRKKKKRST